MAASSSSNAEVDQHQQAFSDDLSVVHQLYSVEVIDEALKKIKFHVAGPADTPYATGIYEVDLTFPENYPEALPEIIFIVPIWNCCVDPHNGRVQFDGETRFTIAEALAFVEDILRANEVDEESIYYKTTRFWNAEFAGGDAHEEENLLNQKVAAIVEMGFSQMSAIIALSGCDWNIGDAAEQLLETPVDEELLEDSAGDV